MKAVRIYRILLRLYPDDYTAMFGTEMLTVFEQTSKEPRRQGELVFVRFVLREFTGLLIGVGAEWIAKWTTDRSVRGRCLPDLRMMRPPGVPRELWFAGKTQNRLRRY
jgi:hypothetical protein